MGSCKDVKSSSVTEEMFISRQDRSHQTDMEPLSSRLPRLPCVYSSSLSPVSPPPSDQVYLQAAGIFQQLHAEKPVTDQLLHYAKKTDTPLPESRDKTIQRQAFQLAFNTLKYQDLLEDIMTDSCFHTSQHISGDLLPLAMVMLFDFQDRRFLLRERSTREGEELHQEVRDLESSLHRCKTKLAASLARCRVKLNLQSVSCILPAHVRTKQHRAKLLPLYAWVNTLKISAIEVCDALRSQGVCEVQNVSDVRESTFCRDPLCPGTLIFSQHALLQHSSLTTTHALNIQDRSVCVTVTVLRPLLFDNGDVLVAGSFSAVTVAHIAVVAAARSGRVLVCGADHTPLEMEEIQELLTQMDIKNVRVLPEAFCSLDEWDAAVQRLKVIVVLPQCSSSALNDPVPTIHCEHGDWDLLQDLSHGSVSQNKMQTLTTQQGRLLAHALTFPKVQTVVYCTRSMYPQENEQLVRRVLEKAHSHPKLLPFRVNGPIFPDDSQPGDTADSKFFKLEPSQFTNGCFVARLSRQADPTKVETVQDVLARAAAKGLLGGIIPEQSKAGKKGKSKKNRASSATSTPSSPSSQERPAQTKSELKGGQDPLAHSDHEEKKGEGDVKCTAEEEGKKGDNKVGKGERKRRGLKGRKRKLKRHSKQSTRIPTVSKHLPKSHKKKPKKKKQAHHKRLLQGPTRSKPRRIPRLTLTLIASAKPSIRFSRIIAQNEALTTARPAPPTAPHTSSKQQVQRHNTEPERAEKSLKDTAKPGSQFKGHMKVVRPEKEVATQKELKPAGVVLPPISSPTSSSLSSRSGASLSRPPSTAFHAQRVHTSASSSSVTLPSIDKLGV